jgi:hypothetical protein
LREHRCPQHKKIDEAEVLELMPGGITGPMAREVIGMVHSDLVAIIEATKLFRGLGEMALVDLVVRA